MGFIGITIDYVLKYNNKKLGLKLNLHGILELNVKKHETLCNILPKYA